MGRRILDEEGQEWEVLSGKVRTGGDYWVTFGSVGSQRAIQLRGLAASVADMTDTEVVAILACLRQS